MEKILLNADNGQVLVMGDWYVKVQYTVLATFLDFIYFSCFSLPLCSGLYSKSTAPKKLAFME